MRLSIPIVTFDCHFALLHQINRACYLMIFAGMICDQMKCVKN